MNLKANSPDDNTPPVVLADGFLSTGEYEGRAEAGAYDPDIWLYRERTVCLLKRYLRQSVEVGRLPSLVGREFFRSKVSSTRVSTFEDSVIFVHDMDCCLEQLDEVEQLLIAAIVLQDYTQDEAAIRLRCHRRTVSRRFCEGLDKLSDLLILGEWISPLPKLESEPCQEAEEGQNPVSHSNCGENNFESNVTFTPLSMV